MFRYLLTVALVIGAFVFCAPSVGSAQEQSVEAEDYLLIQGLLKDEIYELAAQRIEIFLQKYPESNYREELSYRAGEIYMRLQMFDQAVRLLQSLVEEFPQGEHYQSALFLLATAYQLSNQPLKAEGIYIDIVAHSDFEPALKQEARGKLVKLFTDTQRYQRAAAMLEQMLKESPTAPVKLQLANTYFQLKKLGEAKGLYRELLEEKEALSSDELVELDYHLGLIYYDEKKYDEAAEMFRSILASRPGDQEATVALSWCYYHQKEYEEAYRQTKELMPPPKQSLPQKLMHQGEVLILMQEYQAAIKTFNQFLEEYPQDELAPRALFSLADCYLKLDQVDEAIKNLEDFCHTTADQQEAYRQWFRIGRLYFETKKDYNQAVSSFQQVINISSGGELSDLAQMMMVRSWLLKGDYNQAVQSLNLLVNNYPQSELLDDGYFLLGQVLMSLGRYSGAEESFSAVVESFPDSEWKESSLLNWGKIAFLQGKWDECISRLETLLKEYPESSLYSEANYYLGKARYELKDYGQGRENFNNILNSIVDTDEKRVREANFQIGWGYYKEMRYQEAVQQFARLLEKYPDSPQAEEALYWMGWSYLSAGNYEESNQQLEQLVSRFPHGKYAEHSLWLMANNYLALKKEPQALEVFDQLIEKFPEGDFAPLAQQRIEETLLQRGDYQHLLLNLPLFAFNNPGSLLRAEERLAKGDKLLSKGRKREALQAYQALLKDFPNSPVSDQANYKVGETYYQQEKFDQAIPYYKRLVEGFPQSELSPDARHKLGTCCFRTKQWGEAIAHYQICLEDPTFANIADRLSYLIGYAYEQLRNTEQAIAYYQRFLTSLEDATRMVEEQMRLIRVMMVSRHYQVAVDACRRLLSQVKDEDIKTEVQFYLGECFYLWEKPDQAVVEYLKVTYLHPSNPMWAMTACFKAGEIYEKEKKWEEAIKLYKRVAERYKNTKQGNFANERIKRIQQLLSKEGEIKEEVIKKKRGL